MCERNHGALDPLINFESIKRLRNWRFMMNIRSIGDSTCSSIKTELKTIGLSIKEIEKKKIRIFNSTLESTQPVLKMDWPEWPTFQKILRYSKMCWVTLNNYTLWCLS